MKTGFSIWRLLGIVAILLFAVLFFKLVIYLGISLVLFLIGNPISNLIEKIKLGRFRVPRSIAALLTISVMLTVLVGVFFLVVPALAAEINFLYDLNFYEVLHNILAQFPSVKALLLKFGEEEDLKISVATQLKSFITANNLGMVLNNVFGYFGSILGGVLCVLFITFFLLKDENLVRESILVITPSGYEEAVSEILKTSKRMLSKYFAALFFDMFLVSMAVLLVLSLLGVKNALIIAFCAGLLNVIPYIGSIITMCIAVILGVSSCIGMGAYDMIGPTIYEIFFAMLSINLIDGFIVQPFLFSNSVKAHPLEIFIVTLMAAKLGGIFGMVIALPSYTLLRVVAKVFLGHLKFFKKISDTIQ